MIAIGAYAEPSLTDDGQVEDRHDLRHGGHLALVAAGVAGLDVSETKGNYFTNATKSESSDDEESSWTFFERLPLRSRGQAATHAIKRLCPRTFLEISTSVIQL